MSIHSEGLAVITTAHLPEDEACKMEEAIDRKWISGMYREEGWLVNTRTWLMGFPTLSYVLGYMKAQGYEWVLFDRDAPGVAELEAFDW